MTTLNAERTVGELVVDRPARARTFEKLGIDYCCGGRKPLTVACREKGLDPDSVLRQLDQVLPTDEGMDWAAASLTDLADHIQATHHEYLRREMPRLDMLTAKVANAHGANHPEVLEIREVFEAFRAEIDAHMMKEERILFPMIRQLEQSAGAPAFHCGSIANPISVIMMEHDSAGAALERFRALTAGYTTPADVCNTYRAMVDALATLEADMHQHVHKENNILFPRAAELEQKLR